jgi:hypothetical protein
MRLVQFVEPSGKRAVAVVNEGGEARVIRGASSTYELAVSAAEGGRTLQQAIESFGLGAEVNLASALRERRVLAPIDHPDPAHLYVTGTGLTHLGSAESRDKMHRDLANATGLTDSMKMFQLGVQGGKPAPGTRGVQPEWFYKGDGSILVPPEQPLRSPDFALNAGEEPEIAGIYVVRADGTPMRLGFALGNEFSDHVTERQNYLYLAHSKLRAASLGPELLTGELPQDIRGQSRIRRGDRIIWGKEFLSGEDNMCQCVRNLEEHHFKYDLFRRPGDVHVHFFGTGTLSFADGVVAEAGDVFEIEAAPFGLPLRNPLEQAQAVALVVGRL